MRNLERFSRNRKMLHILAGETARLMAFLSGSGLRKDDVLRTLQQLGDDEAVMIYTAYLKGRDESFNEHFLRESVLSRVGKMTENVEK